MNVGFLPDGKTLTWSPKTASLEYVPFQIPCGKCIACRLNHARDTATRCVNEASLHKENSFITLTYSDEHLVSKKLIYKDFQDFMSRLRISRHRTLEKQKEKDKISFLVTGEYGEKTKRPHWHAIIFNWRPKDSEPLYKNFNGDQCYTSKELDSLWGKGRTEIGDVTLLSAGYVARYATKKLVHGKDGEHEFNPISKRSVRPAIGKRFIERYYKGIFNLGRIVLSGGKEVPIPRYYERWLQKVHPDIHKEYIVGTRQKAINAAVRSAEADALEEWLQNEKRDLLKEGLVKTSAQMRKEILTQKVMYSNGHQTKKEKS